jgi:predicted AlkP superfamily phosphohydrolase/phosphomutase
VKIKRRDLMVKILLIGTDAASWNIMEHLVNQGKLPTFQKLIRNGVWGDLESCIYYFTSPAWKCFSTGKNPGKLGACGWWLFDEDGQKLTFVNSTSFKSRELWDILGEHGYTSGIVNMPLTYPPKKINGIMVSGIFNPEKGYTYPPQLEIDLKKENYRVNPVRNMKIDTDKGILERASLTKNVFTISKKLLKKHNFDFFQLVVFCTDEIQHFFWKYMEEKDPKYGNTIENFWQVVDSEIKELLIDIPEDCYTFIISDHGATASKGIFRVNVWLKMHGYLHLKKNNPKSYRKLINKVVRPILPLMRKILPHGMMREINRKLFSRLENVVNTLLSEIDFQKTKAFCIADNCIHLTNIKDYDEFKQILKDDIKKIKNPVTGEYVVCDVKEREEVFSGKYLSSLPELIIIPEEGYRFVGFPRDGGTEELWDLSRERVPGWHRLNGIFIANGPEIATGKKIDNARIYDIVPTILHIFRVPQPRDLDGVVLKEIFKENSELINKQVEYEPLGRFDEETENKFYSEEEEKKVLERLKELGYI